MAAKDTYHDHVRNALVKDGWTITHDPLRVQWGRRDLLIDLGAEKILAAEKDGRRVAIEVKSFTTPSPIKDLEQALGQFVLYHDILARKQPDRTLFLAIRTDVYDQLFQEPVGQILLENHRLKLLVFDATTEEIRQWLE